MGEQLLDGLLGRCDGAGAAHRAPRPRGTGRGARRAAAAAGAPHLRVSVIPYTRRARTQLDTTAAPNSSFAGVCDCPVREISVHGTDWHRPTAAGGTATGAGASLGRPAGRCAGARSGVSRPLRASAERLRVAAADAKCSAAAVDVAVAREEGQQWKWAKEQIESKFNVHGPKPWGRPGLGISCRITNALSVRVLF